jgi:hypothetical protein
MVTNARKTTKTTDKWETGELGESMDHAVPANTGSEQALDDALGSLPISIRMSKALVEDLKTLAKKNGLGYQPYMRMILTQHVANEKR